MHGMFLTFFVATAAAMLLIAFILYTHFENRLREEIRGLEQKHLKNHCEKENES